MEWFESDRNFSVWEFSSDHPTMTLQSNPDPVKGADTRIEVHFVSVMHMLVRPYYSGIWVRLADDQECRRLAETLGIVKHPDGVIILLDRHSSDFVHCGAGYWREAKRLLNEPSLFHYDQPWPLPDDVRAGTIGPA